ncbi:cytoplasmic dynein 1 intermediate chain isoform X3 [Histomonas meleagridis]|uniref:cytoplasmic dynein 1 intermediate chain isoform X3 n=1 Tax=Histomonas meleagridis TaxID=135588 RepID=UPI00355A400F|nr:cytoplasmic dynein 1 intermediate chain isoform X3 [Histomonas meleagridis]KAH0804099.1 cytoplasmic dynein 1 intermediate chain isoform X3 [Histomonas meleagridis]
MEKLQKQLEELKKKREEIVKKRNAECDAIKELTISPEPKILGDSTNQDISKKQFSLEIINEEITVEPKVIPKYTKDIQVDIIPESKPQIEVKEKPIIHIEIEESPTSIVDIAYEETSEPTQVPIYKSNNYSIFWSKTLDNRYFPTSIDWSFQQFAVSLRQVPSTKEGLINIHSSFSPDKFQQLKLSCQPTTVKFLPRSSDVLIAGSSSGRIFLFDKRAQGTPIIETPRYNPSHYSQVISTLPTVQNQFISVASDGTIFCWDIDAMTKPIFDDHISNIQPTVACISDSQLFIGLEDGQVLQRSINKGSQSTKILSFDGPITGLSFKHGTKTSRSALAISSMDCSLCIWSNESSVRTFETNGDAFVGCEWVPNANGVIAGMRGDAKVTLYNMNEGEKSSFALPAVPVCEEFSSDGGIFCVGCTDGSYHLIGFPHEN